MNDIQKKVFELFEFFVKVCDELHLKWYLINGSALGAAKYQGFIPWDDDLDVGMPREDYEKFLKSAQVLLPDHIFLQNYRTDKNFPQSYSKLRNTDTTFIEKGVGHLDMNHGIFIDVFPIDGYVGEDGFCEKVRKKLLSWKIVCAFNDRSSFKIRFRNCVFKLFGCHKRTAVYIEKFERIIKKSWDGCEFVCNHGDRMGKKRIMPKEYYGEGIQMIFEGIDVVVPCMFDEYLTHKYGDWRAELPEDEQVSHHTTEMCDTTISYKKYIDFPALKR